VEAQYDFVWRSLRRLGVAAGDVDDSVQRVFLTTAAKLASVRSGSERSFLFQTALRVAADYRKARRRRREVSSDMLPEELDTAPVGEELLSLQQARRHLDGILDGMPMELRVVFILSDLEEMTMSAIAELLNVPAGTVASRLRRARAEFREKAARIVPDGDQRGGRR
jgi:RNA polymerase sigma-70 factor (ECF subfamily)